MKRAALAISESLAGELWRYTAQGWLVREVPMPCRLILVTLALFGLVVRAEAQQAEHDLRARLVGRVTSGASPTTNALVELLRGAVTVRNGRTGAEGMFEFDDVPISDRLRVFRTGSVYFVPDWFDGGMVVRLDGTIRAIFVVPK